MSKAAKQPKTDKPDNKQNSSGVGNQFQPTPSPGQKPNGQSNQKSRVKNNKGDALTKR